MILSYRGPIPSDLWGLLAIVWERGSLSVQSDWARALAPYVALAASMGFLSTIDLAGDTYSTRWRITAAGLTALQHKDYLTA